MSALLDACTQLPCSLIVDERLRISPGLEARFGEIHRVPPRLSARLKAEWILRRMVKSGDIVLCMGNLPPLLPLSVRVFVFVQNRFLIDDEPTVAAFPKQVRARILIERLWLRLRKPNAHTFIVQTESMREALKSALGLEPAVMPFDSDGGRVSRHGSPVAAPRTYDFLYVASGEPHKNHRNLVEAWVLLAKQDLRPGLCLTVDTHAYPVLCDWIEQKKAAFDLRVTNAGEMPKEAVLGLYRDSKALIFPSMLESFGLPLVEARQAGLPILAAELDYVRDLIDPEESFDPRSPRSMARAVRRFLGLPHPDTTVMDAATFLATIAERGRQACTSS